MRSMADFQKVFPSLPILVVDDDEESLLALATTLRTVGITNLSAVSDSAAVPTMLGREAFSLVLLDLNMPGLSGYEILGKTSELAWRPPFIIVTGSLPPPDFVARLPSDVVAYLTKPVDRERLIGAVFRRSRDRARGFRGLKNCLLNLREKESNMAKRSSLRTRIAVLFFDLRGRRYRRITLLTSFRVNDAVNAMALADNQQIRERAGLPARRADGQAVLAGEDNRAERCIEVGRSEGRRKRDARPRRQDVSRDCQPRLYLARRRRFYDSGPRRQRERPRLL